MGGCPNYGPFLGTLKLRCRIILRDPKRNHNFDNHPYRRFIGMAIGSLELETP